MQKPEVKPLLPAASGGDRAAFDALIGPLVEIGFRLAVSILDSRADAEDAVQEATIKAWRNLDRLKDQAAVRPWFLTIVANQCRSMRRTRWWSVVKVADPERAAEGPEKEVIQTIDVASALRTLSREDRTALFLRFYLDLPLDEVAAVLGISETAAKSRVHRATQRLRPVLQAAGEDR